jgi:hypothetical protein
MNRRLILLNLALLALAGLIGWKLRQRWLESNAHERAIFEKAAQKKALLPPPPIQPPAPFQAAQYVNVAQQILFTKDRNPNVPVDAPPPPPPEPPMPALPSYYGQIAISDPVVFLSLGNGAQKSYHKGDKVGPFELLAFDREKITLGWNGKTVDRKLAELTPKEPQQVVANTPAPTAPLAPSTGVKTFAGESSNSSPDSKIGVDMGAGNRACVMGDTTPAGTVVNGYKKLVSQTLMGMSCHWEQVK